MKKLGIIAFLIILSFHMPGKAGYANGVIRDSIGTISSGRGGTDLAASDNTTLIYDNPAALSRMEGLNWEFILDLLSTNITYRDPQNSVKAKSQVIPLPAIAGAYKGDKSRFAIGLGIFYPAGFAAEYKLVHGGSVPVYGLQTYRSETSLLKILPAVSWQATDKLSFGMAVGPAIQSTEFNMPFTFQTGPLAGTPAILDFTAKGTGLAWNLGLQYEFNKKLTLGGVYINRTDVTLDGTMNVDVTAHTVLASQLAALGAGPTATYNAKMDFKWPRIIGLGIAYKPNPRHRILSDVEWIQWSSAFDKLQLKLSNGNNGGFNTMLGSSSLEDTIPLNWENSYSIKLGYEYFRNKNTLQAGYILNKNPVPTNTLTPLIPGILEHSISLGYEYRGQTWIFSSAYQYSFGPAQSVGTSKIIGGDFDNSYIKVSAHWLFFNITHMF